LVKVVNISQQFRISCEAKIDVHVLLLPTTDPILWRECLQSLENEPVNIHVAEGVPGHIGKARYGGFSQGTSPYVSCVDPDDLVIPGAFAACLETLEAHPEACGVYTDELIIDHDGKVVKPGIWSQAPWNPLFQLEPKYLHHIYVMRRCFVEKYYLELLRWPSMPEFILKGLITAHGPWIHVGRFGYKWRMTKGSAHTRMSPSTICAAQWRVIPALRNAARKYKAVIQADPLE
jgi:hypothetical protein